MPIKIFCIVVFKLPQPRISVTVFLGLSEKRNICGELLGMWSKRRLDQGPYMRINIRLGSMPTEEIRQSLPGNKETNEDLGEIIPNRVGCRVATRNGLFRSLILRELLIKDNRRYLSL
jgi:hypothetical protein